MADEQNANPGGEGRTSTPGKPGGAQGTAPAAAPATAPAPTAPAAGPDTTIPQSIADTKDRPSDTGTLAVDARTVKDAEGNDVRVVGDPDAPLTQVSDPEGKISNRVEGTLQREPRAEDLPPDAKIAPIAEQVAPNQAAQAVGARPQPDKIAGIDQPEEGQKNAPSGEDDQDPKRFLSPESDQHDEADRAAEDTTRNVDRAIDRSRRAR